MLTQNDVEQNVQSLSGEANTCWAQVESRSSGLLGSDGELEGLPDRLFAWP